MSEPILQLSNAANWSLYYQDNWDADYDDPSSTYPFIIGEKVIPILLESHIIAVKITSSTAKATWKSAGYLRRKIRIGIDGASTIDSYLPGSEKLRLSDPTLLIFDKLSTSYALSIRVHDWIQQVSIKIYEYTGINSNSTDAKVDALQTQINTLAEHTANLVELIGEP